MIIMVIAMCIYVLYWIETESFECLDDPYVYSIKLLEKANRENVSCVCTAGRISVLLTREGFSEIEIERNSTGNGKINLSGLKVYEE